MLSKGDQEMRTKFTVRKVYQLIDNDSHDKVWDRVFSWWVKDAKRLGNFNDGYSMLMYDGNYCWRPVRMSIVKRNNARFLRVALASEQDAIALDGSLEKMADRAKLYPVCQE